jgi:serine/threonine protein kinase
VRQPIPFGKYLLLERINVGGMAEIFLARSRGVQGFKRILAIKKILPTMAEDEEFIAMFIDEARIAAELSHAGIVQIFELGKFEEDYYIAMEFIHGKDLRYIQERLAREHRPLDMHLAASVAFKICEALDYAHSKRDPMGRPLGIIHRDISPQNVILSYDGEVKICDFGIAKAANRSQKTQAGVLKGKFGYMSPEQVRGLPLDGRSDIFTVGTLLYELITLERLFLGDSDFSTLEKVRNADVVPPSNYNRDIPEELEEIVLRSLTKEVEDRFQSAADLADALQVFMINTKLTSSRDLSVFMRDSFRSEFDAELRRLEEYQEMPEPELLAGAVRAPEDPAGGDEAGGAADDPDAKTLIFASTDESVKVRTVPPPIPSRKPDAEGAETTAPDKPDLSSAHTKIFEENRQQELGAAQTMIFSEPGVDEAADIHEAPTMLPRPRPPVPVAPTRPTRDSRRSLADRLFFPLCLGIALLLGYSLFTTIRLLMARPGAEAPVFELSTTPSVGVRVFLDGAQVAEGTPYINPSLSAGQHHLRLSLAGHRDLERTLSLQDGSRLVMELTFQRGESGTPDPALAIRDGGSADRPVVDEPDAGLVAVATQAGDPLVESADGAPDGGSGGLAVIGKDERSDPVEQPVKQPIKQPIKPVARLAKVSVTSNPPGAAVLLNGKKVGQTPWSGSTNAGEMARIFLRLRGYQSASQTIRVQAGEDNQVHLTLAKRLAKPPPAKPEKQEFGYLLANTRPWSKVYVDGKYTGRETPIPPDKKLRLSAGKHRITFEVPGGKKFDFEVEIEADKVLKLIKRLE